MQYLKLIFKCEDMNIGDENFKKNTKTTPKIHLNPISYLSNRTSNPQGITLIALIITIIVMLILVGVTVSIAINGGIFKNARDAKIETENAINVEEQLSNGRVKIGGVWYDTLDKYIEEIPSQDQCLPSYEDAIKDKEYLTEKATYTETEGDITRTATIPAGFKISDEEGEGEISTGLVIKDAKENQFVWVPLNKGENLVNEYKYESSTLYEEPKCLKSVDATSKCAYDSQEQLDFYYGKNDDGTSFYTYDENMYETEYAEMIKKVNQYRGFYIGRYETTIDNNSIGSKENKKVLSVSDKLRTGTNESTNEPYYYRWYGLYYEQKKADVTGNGTEIQTAMIYGQLWDRTMEFIREQVKAKKTTYNVDEANELWHDGSPLANSGQANPKDGDDTGDVALNIWDLEGNGREWAQDAQSTMWRVFRGRLL